MKSMMIKKIKEDLGVTKIGGKKLKKYSFYTLVGFYTRLSKGEEIK